MSVAGDPDAAASGRPQRPLFNRVSLGALALTGASALRLALQFVMMPVLARLIGPSEYGLVALAMPFILLANVLADGGLSLALGRQPTVSRQAESTAFWFAAAMGAALAVACALAAFPLGLIMHQPRLPRLVLALAPILLMNSLAAASNGRIVRERRLAVFAAGDLISAVAAACAAFVAATHGFGAWSLVAQQLVLWTCKLAWVTLKGGVRIGVVFNWAEARGLVRFGFHSLGASMADFVSRNMDNLIVGAVLGSTKLGYYAMAYQIIRIPDMLISGPFFFYILTAVARTAHNGGREDMHRLARAAFRLASTAVTPLFCGLALVADLAVPLLLGHKWLGAIPALRCLAGAGVCFCMYTLMVAMLMGLGRSGLQVRMSILLGVNTIVTVGVASPFGVTAVSAALAVGVAMVCAVYLHQLAAKLEMPRRALIEELAPAVLGAAVMAVVVLLVRHVLAHATAATTLVAAVLAGALAYVAVIALVAGRSLAAGLREFNAAHAEVPPEAPQTLATAGQAA